MLRTSIKLCLPIAIFTVLITGCGQSQQGTNNSSRTIEQPDTTLQAQSTQIVQNVATLDGQSAEIRELQTQSARHSTTLQAQSTQMSQNVATLEAQSLQIEEQVEIISLQATLEYQITIIDEQNRVNILQSTQIERLSQPNWLAIVLSLFTGPSLGIALIYALKKMRYGKNQTLSPVIRVSDNNTSIEPGADLPAPSVSMLNHVEIGRVTADAANVEQQLSQRNTRLVYEPSHEENQLPVEQRNSEIESVKQSNLQETMIEHTEVYTRRKKIVHREIERNDLTVLAPGGENEEDNAIKIDFDRVDTLSRDSESIRDRLIVSENDSDTDDGSHPNTITEVSPDKLSVILQSEEFRDILLIMYQSNWEVSRRQLEEKLPNTFLNVILDELNGQTIELMGDNLIYEDDGILSVTEEFQSLVTTHFSSDYSSKSG